MVEELLAYFARNARDLAWRHDPAPYRVWISEIMLQQTRVGTVREYYRRFLEEVPNVETLAALPEERLFKLWEGLGYYSRARNLQKAAKLIVEAGRFPDTLEAIAGLPGVGPYTAGAIASIAFGLPEPAVDGNVLRVLSRIRGRTYSRDEAAAELKPLYPAGRCGDFTQSLMELGALVCLPNGAPLCAECPLSGECVARRDGRIAELPAKTVKKMRRIERKTVLLLVCGGRAALEKRPKKGLLAGLWGFPETGAEADAAQELTRSGFDVLGAEELPPAKHVFSHLEWHMRNLRVELAEPLPENHFVWVPFAEILREYAVPAAYRGIRARLEKEYGTE